MRVSIARTTLSWFVLAILIGGSSPRPVRAEESTLDFVPADAAGFVHVRAADLWRSPAFAEMRGLLGKVDAEARSLFEKRLGINVAQLQEVTLIFPTVQSFGMLVPTGHPQAMSTLVAVRCEKPHNREHLTAAFPSKARLKQFKGESYWFDEHAWAGVHFLSERTFLYGSEDALIWYFNQNTDNNKQGPLTDPLQQAPSKPHALFALNAGLISTGIEEYVPPPIQPLLQARYVSLAITLDKQLTFNARVGFASANDAEDGETAFKALLELGLAQLNNLDKLAQERLNSKEDRLFDSVGNLYGLALVRQTSALLERLSVAREGSRLSLSLQLQGDHFASVGLVSIAAVTALGTNAESTFQYVGNLVSDQARPNEPLLKLHAGLEAYYAKHNAWPARAIRDNNGTPLLSWRVALLPYLGEEELYKQFKLDEAWDSLHNKQLLARMPAVYASRWNDRPWLTRFQVFAGDGAILNLRNGSRKADVRDGLATTVLLVEAPERLGVHWTKPHDLPFQPRLPDGLFSGGKALSLPVLTGDGAVRNLYNKTEPEIRPLITRDGGEAVDFTPMRSQPDIGAAPRRADPAVALPDTEIPKGTKVVSVAVEQGQAGGFILPGSRVDVTCTTGEEGGESATKTIVSDVVVLAVDSQVSPTGRPITSLTVTLVLTGEQAEVFTAAKERGIIGLSLRKPE